MAHQVFISSAMTGSIHKASLSPNVAVAVELAASTRRAANPTSPEDGAISVGRPEFHVVRNPQDAERALNAIAADIAANPVAPKGGT